MSEEHTPRPYSRTLKAAIERMHQRRSELIQTKIAHGRPDERTHARFEESVLTMFYELRPFATDHPQAESIWNESNLERLPKICGQIKRRPQSTVSGGIAVSNVSTEISHADPDELLVASEKMDEIAHTLGFAPSVNENTPTYKLTQEDYDEPVKEGIPKPE